jgi:hypothetical protein
MDLVMVGVMVVNKAALKADLKVFSMVVLSVVSKDFEKVFEKVGSLARYLVSLREPELVRWLVVCLASSRGKRKADLLVGKTGV